MTYSLVAADTANGHVGVAAQSHHLATGAQAVFAEPGVGAVAVQSYADRSYGPRLLSSLLAGEGPRMALDELIEGDKRSSRAQVAVISAGGEVAVHTGSKCVPHAGHQVEMSASAQANMVLAPSVWTDALAAYQAGDGDLAHRLLDGLDAAEAAGGDLRGRQSAALLVVGDGTRIDVRVDDAPEPLVEVRRLTELRIAAIAMSTAFAVAAAGDIDRAAAMLASVQEVYGSYNLEPTVWGAVLLARAGNTSLAAEYAARARAGRPQWGEFLVRLATVGLAPADPETVAAFTGEDL